MFRKGSYGEKNNKAPVLRVIPKEEHLWGQRGARARGGENTFIPLIPAGCCLCPPKKIIWGCQCLPAPKPLPKPKHSLAAHPAAPHLSRMDGQTVSLCREASQRGFCLPARLGLQCGPSEKPLDEFPFVMGGG